MNKKRKILLIGSGSSTRRFVEILKTQNCELWAFQHRKNLTPIEGTIPTYDFKEQSYNAAIIASDTSTHLLYARKLLNIDVPIFVEKPFSDKLDGVSQVIKIANNKHLSIMCGFNLRFLPAVLKIKKYLNQQKLGNILFASLYSGQYLPDWRNQDYQKFYSASYKMGGGVALDLIHEIDLALWLFPNIKLKPVISEKLSNLKIDCEDFMQFRSINNPIVEITLDYLNHIKTRRYLIVGDMGSIDCDIANQNFKYKSADGKTKELSNNKLFDIGSTYQDEIQDFLDSLDKFKEADERSLGVDALKISLSGRKHVQK